LPERVARVSATGEGLSRREEALPLAGRQYG
jgi:hypothetical protein